MKKLLKLTLLCLLFPLLSHAEGWDEAMYKQIEQSIQAPKFADRVFLITKYGAKPDNQVDDSKTVKQKAMANQKAIQKAIDLCSKKGGGRVVVPAGCKFLTGAIELKSGVNLEVQENAVLEFVFEPELYPIVETSWEGLECFNLSPCVYAFKQTDIAVTGKGTIGLLEGIDVVVVVVWCAALRLEGRNGQPEAGGASPTAEKRRGRCADV